MLPYWEDFHILNHQRQTSANGSQFLAIPDIESMFRSNTKLPKATLFRKYLRVITTLDSTFMSNYFEKQPK